MSKMGGYESSSEDVKEVNPRLSEDSDSECDWPIESVKHYSKELKRSRGFDVPDYSCYGIRLSLIYPCDLENPLLRNQADVLSEFAIMVHNYQKETNFKFIKSLKMNYEAAAHQLYFLTFELKDDQHVTKVYQAKVSIGIVEDYLVLYFRPKPEDVHGSTQSYDFPGSSKKMSISNGKVDVIIGKGGETKKYIEQMSGAKIHITNYRRAGPYSLTRVVELKGTPEQVSKAEQLVNDVIAEEQDEGARCELSGAHA